MGSEMCIRDSNIITITRMDRLFGVTMMEPGVSQLVGVDLTRAEELIN